MLTIKDLWYNSCPCICRPLSRNYDLIKEPEDRPSWMTAGIKVMLLLPHFVTFIVKHNQISIIYCSYCCSKVIWTNTLVKEALKVAQSEDVYFFLIRVQSHSLLSLSSDKYYTTQSSFVHIYHQYQIVLRSTVMFACVL